MGIPRAAVCDRGRYHPAGYEKSCPAYGQLNTMLHKNVFIRRFSRRTPNGIQTQVDIATAPNQSPSLRDLVLDITSIYCPSLTFCASA